MRASSFSLSPKLCVTETRTSVFLSKSCLSRYPTNETNLLFFIFVNPINDQILTGTSTVMYWNVSAVSNFLLLLFRSQSH